MSNIIYGKNPIIEALKACQTINKIYLSQDHLLTGKAGFCVGIKSGEMG